MKALIIRLGVEVPVCEYDSKNRFIMWYDGQMSRTIPPCKVFNTESARDMEITEGDSSRNYKCELFTGCQEDTCLKRK